MSDPTRKILIAIVAILALAAWWILADRQVRPRTPNAPTPAADPAPEERPEAPPTPVPEPDAPAAPTGDWKLVVTAISPDGAVMSEQFVARFVRPEREDIRLVTEKVVTFSLTVTGTGTLILACASAPFPPVRIPDLAPPEDGVREITVRFERGLALSGELFHQDGVTPVPGKVLVMPIDKTTWHGTPPRLAMAGEDGRWHAEGLVPGRYRLLADAKDRGHGRRPDPAPEVEAGGPPVRIVLSPVTRIRVRVVVVGDPPEKQGLTILTVSDAKGRSIVSSSWIGSPACEKEFFVPPGQAITVGVDSKGYERVSGGTVLLADDALEAEVEVRMAAEKGPTGTLVLRPVDSLGRPVPSLVVFRRVTATVESGESHVPDGGSIEVVLPVGETKLRLQGPEGGSLIEKRLTVKLAEGERKVVDVTLVVGGFIRAIGYEGKYDELYAGPAGSEPGSSYIKRKPGEEGGILNGGRPVAPGKWVVEWRRKDEPTVRHEVVVVAEKTAVVRF